MSNRKDLETGRLIFTCRCGFIDTGHANPKGPKALWDDILHERHLGDRNGPVFDRTSRINNHHTIEGKPCFLIRYRQDAGNRVIRIGHSELYLIRKGLSLVEKRRPALAISSSSSIKDCRLTSG